MKNDILKNVIISLLLLLSLSLVANASAETKISTKHELQVVETIVLDKETNLYQFALSHQINLDELITLNPNFNKSDVLPVGVELKLPKSIKQVQTKTIENESVLPSLGNNALAQPEYDELTKIGSSLANSIPGTEMVSGTGEENLANAAVFAAEQGWENLNAEQIVDDIKSQAKNTAINTVVSGVNQEINKTASNFLGQFGKAQVNISLDKEGKLSNYEVQLLSPLYDKDESLVFTQAGIHEQGSGDDARLIGNFGVGYRYETNEWLAGANAFIDHDFTGSNTRLGLGAEYWADNYKLAANTYAPLSNWKESDIMKNYEQLIYDERPAKGFDIRAQAYLPNYPQLGGSLMFEQYFGDEVDLFGIDNRQKDPYSLSVGVNYMPVPLLKTELTHKMGKSGIDDTKFDVSLNLQLGTPLEEQLDPDNVAVARSLKGSRYDMVDRNYDIVFEYQKEDFNLELAGTTEASFGDLVNINALVNSRSPIVSYEWFVEDELGNPITGLSNLVANQNTANISFVMTALNNPDFKNLFIKVKVTTERGYSALSKVHVVKFRTSKTGSTLTNSTAEVIDFKKLTTLWTVDFITMLETIEPKYKAVSVFTAMDSEGNPFNVSEVNSTKIQWRLSGEDKFKDVEDNDNVKFFIQPGEDSSKLQITALGDISLIPTSGVRSVEVVIISTLNPEISAMGTVKFTKTDDKLNELGIDLQNITVEIVALPQGANTYSTYDDVVSLSGIKNGLPISVQTAEIEPNRQYRAIIKTLPEANKETQEWVDVTEYFVKSMVWLYWDPYTDSEVTAVNNLHSIVVDGEERKYRSLEECRGSPIFFTQTNNYVFNELGWGEILEMNNTKPRQQKIVSEQGLRLAVQFDFTAINEANPEIDECIPSQQYESEQNYLGFTKVSTGELDNNGNNQKPVPRAVSWISAE